MIFSEADAAPSAPTSELPAPDGDKPPPSPAGGGGRAKLKVVK
jgi:hypothetical protein